MAKFAVPVMWQVSGYYIVEAGSVEDAIDKAERDLPHLPLPDNGEYVDDSFEMFLDETLPADVYESQRTCFCSIFGDKEICGPGCINDED